MTFQNVNNCLEKKTSVVWIFHAVVQNLYYCSHFTVTCIAGHFEPVKCNWLSFQYQKVQVFTLIFFCKSFSRFEDFSNKGLKLRKLKNLEIYIKLKKKTFSTCALIYLIYHFGNQIHQYLFGSQMIDFDNSFPLQTQKNASINNLSCTFFKFKIAHNDIGVPNTLFGSICSNQLGVLKESDNCK